MNILRICGKYVELLTLLWNISSKTVTIFADRYRYEKLKFYYITISNGKRFIKKGVQNNTLFKMPDLTDVVILMENSISLYP